MKVNLFLDKRRSIKNGRYPIKVRIYENTKTAFINTEYVALESEFDEQNGLFLIQDKNTRAERMKANSELLNIVDAIQDLYDKVKGRVDTFISASRLKELYLKGESKNEITLNQCFHQFTALKSGRTSEIYIATLDKIEKYYGNSIYFDDVTFNWLERFDHALSIEPIMRKDRVIKTGLEVNARSIHFRNIRAVFNYAINNELIPLNLYPFRRFKIKREETIKRSVEVEKLRQLFSFNGNESQQWARDIAFIIFGLIGINTKDLYNLSEITDKSVSYKRAKTKRIYAISLEPEIKNVLDKYKTEKGLIFKDQIELKSFGVKINKHLKAICISLGYEKMTTYSLRHSWATIAAELDIPKETIGAALGHTDKSITNVYINFNQKKIDDANRKVLDYLLQKGEYNPKKKKTKNK